MGIFVFKPCFTGWLGFNVMRWHIHVRGELMPMKTAPVAQ